MEKNIVLNAEHTVVFDTSEKTFQITEFHIKFKGDMNDWLREYMENPKGSRLDKNLRRLFSEWLEPYKSDGSKGHKSVKTA